VTDWNQKPKPDPVHDQMNNPTAALLSLSIATCSGNDLRLALAVCVAARLKRIESRSVSGRVKSQSSHIVPRAGPISFFGDEPVTLRASTASSCFQPICKDGGRGCRIVLRFNG
jgi:hypothetical protein